MVCRFMTFFTFASVKQVPIYEMTIEEIFNDDKALNQVKVVAKRLFFLENIEFIESFNEMNTKCDILDDNKITNIYKTFIAKNGISTININSDIRTNIEKALKCYRIDKKNYDIAINSKISSSDFIWSFATESKKKDLYSRLKKSSKELKNALDTAKISISRLTYNNIMTNYQYF